MELWDIAVAFKEQLPSKERFRHFRKKVNQIRIKLILRDNCSMEGISYDFLQVKGFIDNKLYFNY